MAYTRQLLCSMFQFPMQICELIEEVIIKRARVIIIVIFLLFGFSSSARAHMLWINLYESFAHLPGHTIVSLGYGHTIPMDDLLVSEGATLRLATYELVDPDLGRTQLPKPSTENKEGLKTNSDIIVHTGDLGIRKLSLTDKTKPGTYQVVAISKSDFYTLYKNKKGKRKWEIKPMNEIEEAEKIIHSVNYKALAKAFFSVKNWTDPKPLGLDLEIIPKTDLSNVHVGDVVQFQTNFMGRPFSSKPNKLERITAISNSFGGPDGFFLAANIYRGKAQFRMPAAGQWVVSVGLMQEVTSEGDFKELVDKCTAIGYVSSISFNVKP